MRQVAFRSIAAMALFVTVPLSANTATESCARLAENIEASMRKTMAQGSPGMLVAAATGNRPFFERALGLANVEHQVPLRPGHVFAIASLTKQFTAASILLLAEDGKLQLEDRLDRYIPELPQARDITLYQLLVQTSGLPDYAEDPVGQTSKSVARSSDQMVSWIAGLTPKKHFAPGTQWRYSNSNYALLGAVIERVGKMPLAEFYRKRLFEPAGMANTAYDDPRHVVANRVQGYKKSKEAASGFANADWISPTVPGAAGGLRSTAADLVGWSDALHGGRILKPASLNLMTLPGKLSDGRSTKMGMPEAWQKGLNADYAMGVFVTPTPLGTRIWHSGDVDGFSTWLAYYPDSRLTLALLQNSESADMDRDGIAASILAMRSARCVSP